MSQSLIRRKLWWKPNNRAEIDFGKGQTPDIVPFHWVRTAIIIGGHEEVKYRLFWHDEEVEIYATLVGLKLWLIQCAYGIQPGMVIPSEILFDANLGYFDAETWVDNWDTPNSAKGRTYLVIEGVEDITPPIDRCIRLITDSSSRSASMRRRSAPPAKNHSKVRQLTEEIDRITGAYGERYGKPRSTTTYPHRGDTRTTSTSSGSYHDRWERQDRSTLYPPRPADGSNFTPVDMGRADYAWEARTGRKAKEVENVPDEECLFVLTAQKDEETP